jgi:hypothetical protein
MNKILCLVGSILLPLTSYGLELKCEGWYQPANGSLQQVSMKEVLQSAQNWKQELELEGYRYSVDWDVLLDAFYVRISRGGKDLLFTTARVPTFSHNDSFTDLHLSDGTRLSISCSFR